MSGLKHQLNLRKGSRRVRGLIVVLALMVTAAGLKAFDANPALSQSPYVVALQAADDPGLDPFDRTWDDARPVEVPLSAQAGAYIAGGTVTTATVRAVHIDGDLVVRVDWPDGSVDDAAVAVEDFADAAALEFPGKGTTSVPSICMGQAGAAVNIWHWRADSEGGPTDPADVYQNALIDAVPSDEDVFFTARAAGNPYSQPEASPVQDLVARAFGTLSPAPDQLVAGHGGYENGRWYVVFRRSFEGLGPDQAGFSDGGTTDMAVAVWDGSQDERDGRKSVSQFLRLQIMPGTTADDDGLMIGLAIAVFVGLTAIGVGVAVYGLREGRR